MGKIFAHPTLRDSKAVPDVIRNILFPDHLAEENTLPAGTAGHPG